MTSDNQYRAEGVKTCKYCSNSTYLEFDLCYVHEAYRKWLDNTDFNDMGVFRFFQDVIPRAFKNFKYGIPTFHREIIWDVHEDRADWKILDRRVVIAAPRGSSKTTLVSKAYALYCAVFSLKRYIVIVSKTSRMAQKILRWIKNALNNKIIKEYFGDLRPETRKKGNDDVGGKWTGEIVILANGVTIEAIGMNQQLRSSAEGEDSDRIDLLIADDCETDENTKTPERRETNEVWFFETVLPSVDIDTGTVLWIGTMTHTECILKKLLTADNWRKRFYQITYFDSQGKECSLWDRKFPLVYIEMLRKDYENVGRLKSFYKEYYNLVKSDEGFDERWIKFYDGEVFRKNTISWLRYRPHVLDTHIGDSKIVPVDITIGVDLAFSEKTSADFCALVPLARTPTDERYVLKYSHGRYTVYDDKDGERILRKGFVDELIRLVDSLGGKVDRIVVGVEGQQYGYFNLIKEKMDKKGIICIPFTAKENKVDRIKGLQPLYESRRFHHLKEQDVLKRELVSLGDTTDDVADALEMAERFSEKPNPLTFDPFWGSKEYLPAREPVTETNWMVL